MRLPRHRKCRQPFSNNKTHGNSAPRLPTWSTTAHAFNPTLREQQRETRSAIGQASWQFGHFALPHRVPWLPFLPHPPQMVTGDAKPPSACWLDILTTSPFHVEDYCSRFQSQHLRTAAGNTQRHRRSGQFVLVTSAFHIEHWAFHF
jgi:hypothetical protein